MGILKSKIVQRLPDEANREANTLYLVEKGAGMEVLATDEERKIRMLEKMDKPTLLGDTTNYPYVVVVNQNNQTAKMLANGLGKNLSSSDMVIPRGIERVVDVTGAKIGFIGLENKKADQSFNRKVIVNERGVMAYSDNPDLEVTIPDKLNITTGSIANTTITVNYLNPTMITERPNFVAETQQIMAKYKNYDFTPITGDKWTLETKDNLGTDVNTVASDGEIKIKGVTAWNGANIRGEKVVVIKSNVKLPSDKNWILKIEAEKYATNRTQNQLFGVTRGVEKAVQYGGHVSGYDYHGQNPEFCILNANDAKLRTNRNNQAIYLLIKTGGVITTVIYNGDNCVFSNQNANTELGDYIPVVNLVASEYSQNSSSKIKMSYKIIEE